MVRSGSKNQGIQALLEKVKRLEQQVMNSKLFLNMVIHDMRNPANSIEFGLKETLKLLQSLDDTHKSPLVHHNSSVLQALSEVCEEASLGNYDSNLESSNINSE